MSWVLSTLRIINQFLDLLCILLYYSYYEQCCYEIYILLQTPMFPQDSCVRDDNVTWQYWYTINMTGFIPRMIEQEEDMLYNVVPGTYEVVFRPIAKQLGLSGTSTSSIKGWLYSTVEGKIFIEDKSSWVA